MKKASDVSMKTEITVTLTIEEMEEILYTLDLASIIHLYVNSKADYSSLREKLRKQTEPVRSQAIRAEFNKEDIAQ